MAVSIAEPVPVSEPTHSAPTRRSKTITISVPPEMAARRRRRWHNGAGVLVTGDEDLLSFGSYGGARIVTPLEYIELPA
jgi:hypothetical protein